MNQGNGLVISFRSKINTCFMSYVYDPVQGIKAPTTFSDSANRRDITQHVLVVKPADVPPDRCKRDLHNSTRISG